MSYNYGTGYNGQPNPNSPPNKPKPYPPHPDHVRQVYGIGGAPAHTGNPGVTAYHKNGAANPYPGQSVSGRAGVRTNTPRAHKGAGYTAAQLIAADQNYHTPNVALETLKGGFQGFKQGVGNVWNAGKGTVIGLGGMVADTTHGATASMRGVYDEATGNYRDEQAQTKIVDAINKRQLDRLKGMVGAESGGWMDTLYKADKLAAAGQSDAAVAMLKKLPAREWDYIKKHPAEFGINTLMLAAGGKGGFFGKAGRAGEGAAGLGKIGEETGAVRAKPGESFATRLGKSKIVKKGEAVVTKVKQSTPVRAAQALGKAKPTIGEGVKAIKSPFAEVGRGPRAAYDYLKSKATGKPRTYYGTNFRDFAAATKYTLSRKGALGDANILRREGPNGLRSKGRSQPIDEELGKNYKGTSKSAHGQSFDRFVNRAQKNMAAVKHVLNSVPYQRELISETRAFLDRQAREKYPKDPLAQKRYIQKHYDRTLKNMRDPKTNLSDIREAQERAYKNATAEGSEAIDFTPLGPAKEAIKSGTEYFKNGRKITPEMKAGMAKSIGKAVAGTTAGAVIDKVLEGMQDKGKHKTPKNTLIGMARKIPLVEGGGATRQMFHDLTGHGTVGQRMGRLGRDVFKTSVESSPIRTATQRLTGQQVTDEDDKKNLGSRAVNKAFDLYQKQGRSKTQSRPRNGMENLNRHSPAVRDHMRRHFNRLGHKYSASNHPSYR